MSGVTRPDLADPSTYDQGIPHAAFADLRATPGLVRNPDGPWGSGFWSVTRLDDLVAVSRDPVTFSSAVGHIQIYDVDEDVIDARASMIDLDPPVLDCAASSARPSLPVTSRTTWAPYGVASAIGWTHWRRPAAATGYPTSPHRSRSA